MQTFEERLAEARLAAGYPTIAAALAAFGWTKQYYQHERGIRMPKQEALAKYAKGFKVSVDWLLTGRNNPGTRLREVPLMGIVGRDSQVFDPAPEPVLKPVTTHPGDAESVGALTVEDDSNYPLLNAGDTIYIGADEHPRNLVGLQAIVELPNGKSLLKIIEPGSQANRWTLHSIRAGGAPMRNQIVVRAAPVTWIHKARNAG